MASDQLTDLGLESIRLIDAKPRVIPAEQEVEKDLEVDIPTTFGPMRVILQGDVRRPAILTYHDIGLNSTSCFQGFFNYPDSQSLMKHFCVIHVNAIGQHESSPALSELSPYPTLDELAGMLLTVMEHFNKKSFIGFGVGAGANILCRFALMHPDKVEGLIIINCNAGKCGWIEWGYQKWNAWYLKSGQMTLGVEEYLLWHWFGSRTMETNHDLVTVYMDYVRSIKPANLGHFVSAYIQRTDLGIVRELDPAKKAAVKNFKCQVMLVAGGTSPHVDDTVTMNGRLDPANSTWVKFDCGGMVLEETPGKLCEAVRLFLQGIGYATWRYNKISPSYL